MSYISGHAGSGSPLHFEARHASELRGQRVETKYCELCGRMYTRPVIREAHIGRDCPACEQRQADVRAERAVVPPRDVRAY